MAMAEYEGGVGRPASAPVGAGTLLLLFFNSSKNIKLI